MSGDVEDRRSSGGGFGGGGMKIGCGGLLLLGVLSFIFKTDLITPFLGSVGGGGAPVSSAPDPARDAREDKSAQFVSFVLDDLQRTWPQVLPGYQKAKLVLFRDVVQSACGMAESATGPFYCPGDQKVYIDLGFYDELDRRFGAPGDFAQAYVLAHEVGHHVQNILGIEEKMRQAQRANPRMKNQLSVMMELQADCLAGVWGHSASQRNLLEQGDVEEGLNAATAIGDDTLQQQTGGRVRPESFTHGSSAQRVEWFRRGLREGRVEACDTFGQMMR
jgi:hypothetical protein